MASEMDDLLLKIRLMLDKGQAGKELEDLLKQLERLQAQARSARKTMDGLFASGNINQRQYTEGIKNLNQQLGEVPKNATGAGKSLFSFTNLLRTAIGTLEAMGIFLVTSFIAGTIKKTIDSVSQLEQAFIKLTVAERAISATGVDITPKELTDISERVANTYATVSDIDAKKMTANLAVLTKDLKLSADEYEKLAMAIPLVAQQAGVSMDSATEQVINGLTKSGKGWADLGITVDANIIKQRAVTDGIVESAEAYNELTAEQKQQVEVLALINILLENTNENAKEQANYLNTIAGSSEVVKAGWEDFLATLGQIGRPIYIQALQSISDSLTKMRTSLEENRERWADWSGYIAFAITLVLGIWQNANRVMSGRAGISLNELIQQAKAAMEEAKSLSTSLGAPTEDTPTGKSEVSSEIEEDTADLQKALEKMNNEILEAQIKLGQDMEEAQIDLGRKLADIATEYAKKRADAERDYANKVRDINASYSEKVRSINSKAQEEAERARNDELQREAEFQNKMMELKENYLMDLEEALHERDARQVLRLMKQYNLDKTQAERDHALDRQNAARSVAEKRNQLARERADAEADRKMRLDAAKRDYQDKLEKLRADEEAEKRAAQIAFERKMQDLQREMHNRLSLVAAGLVQEFNLTKKGLDAIYSLYKTYYGAISQIYSAMNTMLAGQSRLSATTGATVQPGGIITNNTGNRLPIIGTAGVQRFAEGGAMIADRPTTVTFGEAGLEMAQFTPIGKNGRDVNKLFSNLSGRGGEGGGGGAVEIGVTLSPDLEARVVNNALEQTANIITRVRDSKVR